MPKVKTEPGYSIEQAENDIGALRGSHDALNEYAELTTAVVAGQIFADHPGQTHSLNGDGIPMTQETAQSFGSLTGSWTIPGSGYANYKISALGEIWLNFWIKSPSTNINNPTTICTFPVNYRPNGTVGFPVLADVANNSAGNASCGMTITSAGVMQSFGVGALSNVYFNCKIPLAF